MVLISKDTRIANHESPNVNPQRIRPRPRRRRHCFGMVPSSEDEDYLPPGSPDQWRQLTRNRRNQQDPEEDIPLAQRRRAIISAMTPSHQIPGNLSSSSLQLCPELPQGVIINILLKLVDLRGSSVPIIPAAACVNRAWRAAVQSCPALWRAMDLSYGWCRPTSTIIISQSHKWGEMRSLCLTGCSKVDHTGLEAIAKNCLLLSDMNLSNTKLRANETAQILSIMLKRPRIEGTSEPLSKVNLSRAAFVPLGSGLDIVLREVLFAQAVQDNNCGPVLKTLIVEECPYLSHRPLKAFCEWSVANGCRGLEQLKALSLSGSGGRSGGFIIPLLKLQFASPNLEDLDLTDVCRDMGWDVSLSEAGFPERFDLQTLGWPNMRRFRLTAVDHSYAMFDMRILRQCIQKATSLEELTVINLQTVYWDEVAAALPISCDNLRELHLNRIFSGWDSIEKIHHSFLQLLTSRPDIEKSLEVLSMAWSRHSLCDSVCWELAKCRNLLRLDARESQITEKGVKALFESANRRGILDRFTIDIASCRSVARPIRQAASRGMKELAQALGVV